MARPTWQHARGQGSGDPHAKLQHRHQSDNAAARIAYCLCGDVWKHGAGPASQHRAEPSGRPEGDSYWPAHRRFWRHGALASGCHESVRKIGTAGCGESWCIRSGAAGNCIPYRLSCRKRCRSRGSFGQIGDHAGVRSHGVPVGFDDFTLQRCVGGDDAIVDQLLWRRSLAGCGYGIGARGVFSGFGAGTEKHAGRSVGTDGRAFQPLGLPHLCVGRRRAHDCGLVAHGRTAHRIDADRSGLSAHRRQCMEPRDACSDCSAPEKREASCRRFKFARTVAARCLRGIISCGGHPLARIE